MDLTEIHKSRMEEYRETIRNLRAELEAVKAKCAEYREAAHDRTAAWTAAESELARLKDRVAGLDGAMRSLLTLTKFELGNNSVRDPWARVLAKCEAALTTDNPGGVTALVDRSCNPNPVGSHEAANLRDKDTAREGGDV
jgi:hypothetical protein